MKKCSRMFVGQITWMFVLISLAFGSVQGAFAAMAEPRVPENPAVQKSVVMANAVVVVMGAAFGVAAFLAWVEGKKARGEEVDPAKTTAYLKKRFSLDSIEVTPQPVLPQKPSSTASGV